MSLPASPTLLTRTRRRLTSGYGRNGTALLLFLLLVVIGSLIFAVEAEPPWGKTVEKRLAKGLKLDVREYRIIGLWWASLASAGLATALIATSRGWLSRKRTLPDHATAPASAAPGSVPRWFWLALVGVTVAGACERFPRLNQSLWNDEEYSMRTYSHGEWVHKDGATTLFKPVPWDETLFENKHGNNHVFTSAASRLSLDAWRAMTGAPREAFSEAALRMPSFVSSLLAIIVVGWLGFQMGGPAVGLAAAALLAISPWHIRYSAESKGYSTMMFFMVLNLAAALEALRSGKIRWWLVFAFSEAGYLLCFAGSVYVAMAVNALLLVDLWTRRQRGRIFELVAFNLIGALPVIWWMFPNIPQLISYLHADDSPRLAMGWPWIRDLLSGWAIGWGHSNPLHELHLGTSWEQEFAEAGMAYKVLMLGVLPLLALAGLIAAFRKPLAQYLGITAVILAALMAYTHNALNTNPMWVWYLIYSVIPMVLMLPMGIQWLLTRCCPKTGAALMAALVASLTWATWGSTERLRDHDRQPIRETVAYVKELAPQSLTATFGVSDRQAESYDPAVHVLPTMASLDQIIAESKNTSLPLFVYLCGESVTGPRHPEMFQRVKASGEFEHLRYLQGTEEMFSYHVYRWVGVKG